MKLRVRKDHLSAQVRRLYVVASDVVHIQEMPDGIQFSSASGADLAEVSIWGMVEDPSPVNAVCSKSDLRFLVKGIKAWPRGKSGGRTVQLDIVSDRLTAHSKRRPSCRASIPLVQASTKIIPPSSWTTTVVAKLPEGGMEGIRALIHRGPTMAPEKGVTRLSGTPDQMRLLSFDGVGLTEHSVGLHADGSITVDVANEVFRKAIAAGLFSEGLMAIGKNELFAKFSRNGCTWVTALAPALELDTVLAEIDRAADRVEVQVNPNKLGRACKTIIRRQSRYVRITFHDDWAEVFDATQLVPRDVRRIALRPNRQYGLTGNLDAAVTSGVTPPSLVVDANALLRAIKPFAGESEVQLSILGGEAPSIIVVQGKSNYPRCFVPTPKLLGLQVPSTIHLPANDHLRDALDVVAGSVGPLDKKHVWLSQHDGQMYLSCLIEKKRESDGSQFPVLFIEFAIDATGQLDGVVPLSPTVLEQIVAAAKDASDIDIEVGEDEVSVRAEGHRYSEQLAGKAIPMMGLACPIEEYGTYGTAELARALHEILPPTDTVPGAGASIALLTDGRTLTMTAGSYTRRAAFSLKDAGESKPPVKALLPKYGVAGLARYLLGIEFGAIEVKAEGETLLLKGEGFSIALYPHIAFHVVTGSASTLMPGSALYLFDRGSAHQLVRVIDAARTHHRDPSVFLQYSDGHLHVRYQASGDGPALSVPVQAGKGLGVMQPPLEVGGEDLKNALLSTIAYVSSVTPIFLAVRGDQAVHIGRLGKPNFTFEIAQITRRPFAKHDRVRIFAALGGQYRVIAKSLCRRVLMSHYHLPPAVKNNPETFPEFLWKNGLDHCEIMIDNGAFSARLAGVELDEATYLIFLQANAHLPNLVQYCMNDSYFDTFGHNLNVYIRMVRDEGLDPIYIFHLREPWEGLERLVNGEYGVSVSRLGWGGAAVDAPELRLQYVTRGTAIIAQSTTDLANLRIHGFGMVSQISILQTVPLTTADASSFSIWAQNFQLPTPWGMVSLKNGNPHFVTRHPLKKHVARWIKSLGYEKGPHKIEFRLNRLAEDSPKGLELRTLFGLAYYQWLEEGWKYVDILRREKCFIPMNELRERGPFIHPETENVPRPNSGNMKPIRLTI